MKFRVLIHKRAYEFLKDLKPEEKQRIVIKLKQLEDSPGFDLTLLRLQAKRTPTYYELAITKRYSKFTSENSLAKFKARATRHDFTGGVGYAKFGCKLLSGLSISFASVIPRIVQKSFIGRRV